MSEAPENLEDALMKSIPGPSLRDTLGDLAEIGIDAVMEEGLAKEIPFVGSLFKLYDGYVALRDRHFVKKFYKFLFELSDIPMEEKAQWSENIATDKKEGHKVGETIMLLLEHADDMEKPHIIGRLFKAHIQGQLDFAQFKLLSTMVNRAYIDDLKLIQSARQDGNASGLEAERLAMIGLLTRVGTRAGQVSQALSGQVSTHPTKRPQREAQKARAQIEEIEKLRWREVEEGAYLFKLSSYGQLLRRYAFDSIE